MTELQQSLGAPATTTTTDEHKQRQSQQPPQRRRRAPANVNAITAGNSNVKGKRSRFLEPRPVERPEVLLLVRYCRTRCTAAPATFQAPAPCPPPIIGDLHACVFEVFLDIGTLELRDCGRRRRGREERTGREREVLAAAWLF